MTSRRRVPLRVGLAVGMITAVGIGTVGVRAANALPPTIAGQATNFDVRNDTDKECEGFEVDIEDISATDVTYTWPGNSAYVNPFGSAKTITNTTFPDGHSGVVVKMQANYVGGAWDAFTPVGQLDHFGVHGGRLRTDGLDPDLEELPVPALLRTLTPEHGADVIQFQ